MLTARRSLTLAIYPFHLLLLTSLLGCILCPHKADINLYCAQPTLARPCAGVHKKILFMSFSICELLPLCSLLSRDWYWATFKP